MNKCHSTKTLGRETKGEHAEGANGQAMGRV